MSEGYQVVKMCECGNCIALMDFHKTPKELRICSKCGTSWLGATDTIAKKAASPFKWEELPDGKETLARHMAAMNAAIDAIPPALDPMDEQAVVTR